MIGKVDLRDCSIANLAVGGGDPVTLIEAAAAAGFGAVGLVLRTATGKPLSHEIVGRPEIVRAVKAAAEANTIRVFDVEAFILAPDADMEAYRRVLATGAELGATHISSVGTEWLGSTDFLSDEARIDLFGRLCDEAARFDLHVGVEFMLYRDVRTLAEALAMIGRAGRPNAGVILDTLHFHRAGGTAAEVAATPPERVAYVQLCDCGAEAPALTELPKEARTSRLHLGHGTVDLHGILDAAPAGVQIVIETPVPADAALSTRDKVRRAAEEARRFFAARAELAA